MLFIEQIVTAKEKCEEDYDALYASKKTAIREKDSTNTEQLNKITYWSNKSAEASSDNEILKQEAQGKDKKIKKGKNLSAILGVISAILAAIITITETK